MAVPGYLTGELIGGAVAGDEQAWRTLVRMLSTVALRAAKAQRLGDADALDVCQNTWLSLARRLPAVREPTRLPGWVATTARRQAIRIAASRQSEVLLAGQEIARQPPEPSPEARTVLAERDRTLWQTVALLPAHQQHMLTLLAERPELTYEQIAAELGIRPGSVGPLRKRCLDRVRAHLLARGITGP